MNDSNKVQQACIDRLPKRALRYNAFATPDDFQSLPLVCRMFSAPSEVRQISNRILYNERNSTWINTSTGDCSSAFKGYPSLHEAYNRQRKSDTEERFKNYKLCMALKSLEHPPAALLRILHQAGAWNTLYGYVHQEEINVLSSLVENWTNLDKIRGKMGGILQEMPTTIPRAYNENKAEMKAMAGEDRAMDNHTGTVDSSKNILDGDEEAMGKGEGLEDWSILINVNRLERFVTQMDGASVEDAWHRWNEKREGLNEGRFDGITQDVIASLVSEELSKRVLSGKLELKVSSRRIITKACR